MGSPSSYGKKILASVTKVPSLAWCCTPSFSTQWKPRTGKRMGQAFWASPEQHCRSHSLSARSMSDCESSSTLSWGGAYLRTRLAACLLGLHAIDLPRTATNESIGCLHNNYKNTPSWPGRLHHTAGSPPKTTKRQQRLLMQHWSTRPRKKSKVTIVSNLDNHMRCPLLWQ